MTPVKLQDENIINDFCVRADEILLTNNIEEAFAFQINFKNYLKNNPDFEQYYPQEFKLYSEYIVKFDFLLLNQKKAEKLPDFFEKHWVEQYDIPGYMERNFFDLFDAILIALPIFEDRDEVKLKIIDSLKKNIQIIVPLARKVNTIDTTSQGSMRVGELIADFEINTRGKKIDALQIAAYLNELQKQKLFSSEIRKRIEHLLNFYKILSISSLMREGAEEPYIFVDENTNELKVLKRGIEEVIQLSRSSESSTVLVEPIVVKKTDPKAVELYNKYLLRDINLKVYEKEKVRYKKLYENFSDFLKEFHQIINDRKKEQIIAALTVIASHGHLDEIFERDIKIKEIFKTHLAKKFTEKLAQHFEANLREPVYLSYFLQHILKDILKLNENESAVLAIKLVNELKRAGDKQYLPIAYGDLQAGIFKWKGIVEKDDRLELEE